MNENARRLAILGIIAATIIVLLAGTALIFWFFFSPSLNLGEGPLGWPAGPFTGNFQSNGERIYFTGTSSTGPPITAQMQGMHQMPPGGMACATCHGADGRGGTVQMMMGTFEAPDIRYKTLTEGQHEDQPPYTEETIKRAITQGVDPAGEPLEWVMPRWNMSEDQLDDLLAYLKTLQ